MKPPTDTEQTMNAKTAALALISAQIVAVINTELGSALTVEVEQNGSRGLFLAAEGADADLERLRAFVAAKLAPSLSFSDSYPADEDGPRMDFYTIA